MCQFLPGIDHKAPDLCTNVSLRRAWMVLTLLGGELSIFRCPLARSYDGRESSANSCLLAPPLCLLLSEHYCTTLQEYTASHALSSIARPESGLDEKDRRHEPGKPPLCAPRCLLILNRNLVPKVPGGRNQVRYGAAFRRKVRTPWCLTSHYLRLRLKYFYS